MRFIKKVAISAVFVSMLAIIGVFAGGDTADASSRCVDNQYRRGSQGQCVKYIQQMLNATGSNWQNARWSGTCLDRHVSQTVLAIDGSFGPATDAKTRSFQRAYCLKVDGIVGPQTWRQLCQKTSAWYNITTVTGATMYNTGHLAGGKAGCNKLGFGHR